MAAPIVIVHERAAALRRLLDGIDGCGRAVRGFTSAEAALRFLTDHESTLILVDAAMSAPDASTFRRRAAARPDAPTGALRFALLGVAGADGAPLVEGFEAVLPPGCDPREVVSLADGIVIPEPSEAAKPSAENQTDREAHASASTETREPVPTMRAPIPEPPPRTSMAPSPERPSTRATPTPPAAPEPAVTRSADSPTPLDEVFARYSIRR